MALHAQKKPPMPCRCDAGQRGFSLIELMVVVAIVAILAAIAIPIYLRYTARAQSTAALSLITAFEPAVANYYSLHGTFAGITGNKTLGMPSPESMSGGYIESVQVGTVTDQTLDIAAVFCNMGSNGCDVSKSLSGKTIYLSAFVGDNDRAPQIQWVCWVNDESEYPYVPSSCRHTHRRPINN